MIVVQYNNVDNLVDYRSLTQAGLRERHRPHPPVFRQSECAENTGYGALYNRAP